MRVAQGPTSRLVSTRVFMQQVCALLLTLIFTLPVLSADRQPPFGALDRGDFASAEREARALVKQQPASAAAHVALARAYMGLNNAQPALAELHEALRLDPRSLDALYYVSKLTQILSQQQFMQVTQQAPNSARAHQIQAEVLEAHGDAAGAEKEYLAALAKRPDTPYILNALGDLARHTGRYEDAIGWYAKVIAKHSTNYDALYGTAVSYKYSRSAEAAIPWYRRALKSDPHSVGAKMALGQALLLSGNAQEAATLLEEVSKVDPNLRTLQFFLGRAYQLIGRTEDSRRAFQRARELSSTGREVDVEDR